MKKIIICLVIATSVSCTKSNLDNENLVDNRVELSAVDVDMSIPPPPPNDDSSNDIFVEAEEHPRFPGGDVAMRKYISENLNYQDNISGRVLVQFVIEKDGSISNAKVLRGIRPDCDAEALRVISEMPNWEPAKQNGQEVRIYYNMPVVFKHS